MVAFDEERIGRLQTALEFANYTTGKTHNFYHYPARFSPEFARTIISDFSGYDQWVLDPFMGGGTSIVEGLALGRRMIGIDLNALACFVASTRTTPLSLADQEKVRAWAQWSASLPSAPRVDWVELPGVRNLPRPVEVFIAEALAFVDDLPLLRQRAFARCTLLRLGQWALDCRDFSAPRRKRLACQLPKIVHSMLEGLDEFVAQCRSVGVSKHRITSQRLLFNRSTVGLENELGLRPLLRRVKLVVTSPPYPGVHVLYHRWQYRGRAETPAPYWIANVVDGCGESFYTFGNRKVFFTRGVDDGMARYTETLTAAFKSIRPYLASDALVFQLVAFPDVERQLPPYLSAIEAAGYEEIHPWSSTPNRPGRQVPNRKWYARSRGNIGSASELLLVHHLKP